ncbi:MAG TPA: hypothetical protein VMW41_03950 [Candidatus Bathyarchaeia archaeon]|nr:hypothetical protein [Candidatus Bathyarchaeia archaeon]
MKRLIYLFIFFLLITVDLSVCFFGLRRTTLVKNLPQLVNAQFQELSEKKVPAQVYAALPETIGEILVSLETGDARPVIIEKYLKKYGSTMKPYGQIAKKIVDVSDELGLDWRLLVAIAQQESNLGKKMPPDCNNAWGYGIHSRGTLCFESWEEGIEKVARGIKKKYVEKGLDTPEEIMAKYTPLSSGSWASGVNQFLEDLRLGDVE